MIEINKISKKYDGQWVLDQLDIVVNKGEIKALLGANGSGKSTLVNIIAGLISSDSGSVKVDKCPIIKRNRNALKSIGFVFEEPIYIDVFTAYEYLDFVGELHEVEMLDRKNRILELIDFFDLPLDKRRIEAYSKGMKNKVSLAAALLNSPAYLVLDEPFDGLDFVSVQKTFRLLTEMSRKGTGVLFTSHQYGVISEMATELAILKNGKIELSLSKAELYDVASREFQDFEGEDCVKIYLEKFIRANENRESLSWI